MSAARNARGEIVRVAAMGSGQASAPINCTALRPIDRCGEARQTAAVRRCSLRLCGRRGRLGMRVSGAWRGMQRAWLSL